jgi:hypothetical protein
MNDRQTVEWIVNGLANVRFKNYLGPLRKYRKPCELLPDLRNGCEHKKYKNDNSACRTMLGTLSCYRCKRMGHAVKQWPNSKRESTYFKCGGH